jgi:hypothetical protein
MTATLRLRVERASGVRGYLRRQLDCNQSEPGARTVVRNRIEGSRLQGFTPLENPFPRLTG